MKYCKKVFLDLIIFSAMFLYLFTTIWVAEASEQFGAILVAHGGMNPELGTELPVLHKKMDNRFDCPVDIAYLGYIHEKSLADAIAELTGDGKTEILLVHIAPSSYSYNEQIETYALSLVPPKTSVVVTAMDDDPLAVEMLKESAKKLSENPEHESLMLVGGGPIKELENVLSLIDLENIGEKIRKELGFKEVVCLNLRSHSPDVIYIQSINDLQRETKRLAKQGRVILVPYVFQNDFHKELESFLKGIVPPGKISISKEGIMENAYLEQWVEQVISAGMNQPRIKKVNRNWSAMKDEKGRSKNIHNYGFDEN